MVVVKKIGGLKDFLRRVWRTLATLRLVGPDYEFEVWEEPPLLYLDHWALRRLSENRQLGQRFLAAFEHRGTLMFSLMNVLEIARDASPQRASQVRSFLEKIEVHWVPMTIDPLRIVDAEETATTPDGNHACISVGFITDPRFARRLTSGQVSLAHVVDLTRGAHGSQLRQENEADEKRLLDHLMDWRDAYAANPKVLDRKFPLLDFDPAKPTRGIYYGLARYTITDSFGVNGNHARDLFHAIASVRCAEMVTLDAHWTAQVAKLKLPFDFVRVYSESEFARFLADLEALPPTR
jgi:hypothetical protein